MDSHIMHVIFLLYLVPYDLKCLYEIAHVGYVEYLIDYEFLLMIIKG